MNILTLLAKIKKSKKRIDNRDEISQQIDEFTDWLDKCSILDSDEKKRVLELIDKAAIWYELRYPDYDLDRIFIQKEPYKSINDIMFKDNNYFQKALEKGNLKGLKWSKFYNAHTFIQSLPQYERHCIQKPSYPPILSLDSVESFIYSHIHLSKKGTIIDSDNISGYTHGKISDDDICGLNITEFIKLLKDNGIEQPGNKKLEEAVDFYNTQLMFKEKLLDVILCKILEKDKSRVGRIRASLFAREFDRNIDDINFATIMTEFNELCQNCDWKTQDLLDFANKVATWYEFRYPTEELIRLQTGNNTVSINKKMFEINPDFQEMISKEDISELEWSKLFNLAAFLRLLPEFEQDCLAGEIAYPPIIYIKNENNSVLHAAHIHVTKEGYIEESEDLLINTRGRIQDKNVRGLHVTELKELLEKNDIEVDENSELQKAIDTYNFKTALRKKLLDAIMYRIIQRGGSRTAPRLALLFAKEFNLDIDIPMKYGYESSDPHVKCLINEYLKAGGSLDFECYDSYFQTLYSGYEQTKISIAEALKRESRLTQEEKELMKKLVNALAGQVDYDEVNKAKVKQKRLERKLNGKNK